MLGTYGIPLEKAKDIFSLGKLAYTGKFKDKYGNEKEISEEDADVLKILIGPLFAVSVLGVASPDVSSLVRKTVKLSTSKKKMSKEALKEADPDLYNELYGEGSEYYESEKIKKEMKKEMKQD
jgi:hypothetical protein